MELCAGFKSGQWRELRPQLVEGDDRTVWEKAIGVFERRMKERFFRCIDALLEREEACPDSDTIRPGFSTMALCCLLVETLQSFYEGGRQANAQTAAQACPYPTGRCIKEPSTARAFKDFLSDSIHFKKDFQNSQVRGDFAVNVRNPLLHEAETRGGWLIRRTDPPNQILRKDGGGYVLNRTNFYRALYKEFEDYLTRLRNPSQTDLRCNFLKKMDSICATEPGIE